MDSSDPLLSSLNINKKSSQNKKIALPKEVINLLDAQNVEHINSDLDHDDPFPMHLDVEHFD